MVTVDERSPSAPNASKRLLRAPVWSGLSAVAVSAVLGCSAGRETTPGGFGTGGAPSGGAPGTIPTGAPTSAPTGAPTGTPIGTGGTAPAGNNGAAPFGSGGALPVGAGGVPPFGGGGGAPPVGTGGVAPVGAGGTSVTPPPGTTEFSLTTTPFTLNPGEEKFKCQNMANTLGKDIAIVQASATMAKGSHHMFVFYDAMFNQNQPLEECTGTEFHDFLILTQSPNETQTYPTGVGRLLKSTEGFRFGMHYLNTTTDALQANVTARFDYKDPTAVAHLAAQMELNQGLIRVPVGTSTQTRTFNVPYDISMMYAISHMHKRATHFKATGANQTLYETTIWDEPIPKTYDPALQIPAGSTITYACDYNNDTGMTLTFGESAQTNEMCIFFGVFYASQPSSPQGQGLDQLY